jgi:hypothetical protein
LPDWGAKSNATPAPIAAPTTAATRMPVPRPWLMSLTIASLSVDDVDLDFAKDPS